MRHRLALRDKMRDFFVRVWSHTARMRSHEDATARLRMLLMRGTKYALACSARARSVYEISRDLSGISHFRSLFGAGMGSKKVGWEARHYTVNLSLSPYRAAKLVFFCKATEDDDSTRKFKVGPRIS